MIQIKLMPKEDIPQVLEIYAQGVEGGHSTFNTVVPTAEEWDKGHLDICRIGAYRDGKLVGWSALSATSSRECYKGVCEVSLYVRNGWQSQGVGTLLMEHTVKESEAAGVWSLYAAIFSINTASIKMCLKNGWRVVGTRERIAKDRFGTWQDTTIMERRSKIAGMD